MKKDEFVVTDFKDKMLEKKWSGFYLEILFQDDGNAFAKQTYFELLSRNKTFQHIGKMKEWRKRMEEKEIWWKEKKEGKSFEMEGELELFHSWNFWKELGRKCILLSALWGI